jgi:hypothetical protein
MLRTRSIPKPKAAFQPAAEAVIQWEKGWDPSTHRNKTVLNPCTSRIWQNKLLLLPVVPPIFWSTKHDFMISTKL